MDGFTYNGIHSSKLGCYLAQNAADRWFQSPDFENYKEEINGRDGGYYYGNRAKIRSIALDIFFEDITIGTREKIRQWLDRNSAGDLIFDSRPFETYRNVRLGKVVPGKIYTTHLPGYPHDTYSGTFTATFELYEPYGYLNYKYYTDYDRENAGSYSGMMEVQRMPEAPTADSTTFLMYNPGTIACDTVLTIAGSAPNGITITNATNGTKCALNSLPASGSLVIDSAKGTVKAGGNMNFSYHDEGYLKLAPYGWKYDDITAETTAGSDEVMLDNCDPGPDMVGKYIWLNGKWRKITAINGHIATIEDTMSSAVSEICTITGMNELTISGDGYTLTSIAIDYAPIIP